MIFINYRHTLRTLYRTYTYREGLLSTPAHSLKILFLRVTSTSNSVGDKSRQQILLVVVKAASKLLQLLGFIALQLSNIYRSSGDLLDVNTIIKSPPKYDTLLCSCCFFFYTFRDVCQICFYLPLIAGLIALTRGAKLFQRISQQR